MLQLFYRGFVRISSDRRTDHATLRVHDEIDALASEMKHTLGTGGSARGGEILIQGDRRQDVLSFLTKKGLKARII